MTIDDYGHKWLTPAELIKCLNQLQPDVRLYVNQVGNLAFTTPDGTQFLGFIDFVDGSVQL